MPRPPVPVKDRRRSPRVGCNGSIDFRIHGWYLRHGRIRNLCLDGCLIESRQATGCAVGDLLDLRFEIKRVAFRARAVVRSVHADGSLGVEILDLSGRNRTQLRDLLAELAGEDGPASQR